MREKTEIKNNEEHIPSSCKRVLEMLANQPATYNPSILLSTTTNPNNNSTNLLRAYIACQNGLEISPLLSKPEYSIFVTPEKADGDAAEARVLQKHGKFSIK